MVSSLHQLATIILVAFTLQVLVNAQDLIGNEENAKISDLQKIINSLLKLRAAQKEHKALMMIKEDSEADSSDEVHDDDRQSRSNLKADRDHLCMVVKIGELNLGTHDIAYKPSKLDEFGCDAVHERNYGSVIKQNRMLCYVRGNTCENSNKIIPVSVYKREKGEHCWVSETKNVSVGCNCHFPIQYLGYKPFVPGR